MFDFHLGLVDFAGHVGEFRGAAAEDDGRVSFGNGESADDPESASKDSHEAFYPSPTFSLTKETTDDWSYFVSFGF
jgi:hypothetical protein